VPPGGYDAGKKINGRKRFIVTDTMGMLITVMVCAASVQDRDGAKSALLGAYLSAGRCRFVFADAVSRAGWSNGRPAFWASSWTSSANPKVKRASVSYRAGGR
jgi:hypothetical protein